MKSLNAMIIYTITYDTTCEVTSGSLVTGDTVTCTTKGSQTNVGTSTKTLLTVTITNAAGNKVTSNYDIKKENGTLEVKKAAITVTAKNQDKVYDGKALNANSTCEVTSGSIPSDHTLTCTNTGSITTVGTNAKTLSTVTIKKGSKNLTSYFTITKANGTLTVKKRPITVKCKNQSKTYNGTALQATNECNVTSDIKLVSGHTLTCTCSGSRTATGTSDKIIGSVSIKKGTTNVKPNYDVTPEDGTLTVNKRKITIKCDNQSKAYDGTALKANDNCSPTSGSLLSTDKVTCNCTGSQTEIGTGTKTLKSVKITKGSGEVNYYDVTSANGTLTVTKRDITVTATDQSKTYNGSALSANNECKVTSGSLLSGHTISCTCTGTQTSVGSSTKTLSTVTVSPTKAADYYNITKVNGKLTVNAAYDPTNPGPSDSSCNRHYYYLTWDCVDTTNGSYASRGHSEKKSGYASDAAALTACRAKKNLCTGKSQTDGNVSCSAGVAWGIKYWNESKQQMSSLWPYQGGCGSKPKCAKKCF
jgi:hypothetical protein